MLAQNLAHHAVMHGFTARFTTASAMLGDLNAQDGAVALRRRLHRYVKPRDRRATTFLTSESETADTGFETEDTGLPPATDPKCIAFGKHLAECIPRLSEYAEYLAQDCEYSKMSGMVDGPACVEAMDAFFVCLTMADCADLKGSINVCQKEQDAMDAACPGFDDTDTDSDPNSTDASSG